MWCENNKVQIPGDSDRRISHSFNEEEGVVVTT